MKSISKALILLSGLFLAQSLYGNNVVSSRPILFIHGFNEFGLGEDCQKSWAKMEDELTAQGFSGQKITVGYYGNDNHCDAITSPQGTILTHITDLSKDFAWYVYNQFSNKNIDVDLVTHSMGGLIARYALYRVSVGDSSYPPFLKVTHVTTLAAPFTGYNLLGETCHTNVVNLQCDDMFPYSSFIQSLKTKEALVPQGQNGTLWTNVGSKADFIDGSDGFVTAKSATSMKISKVAKMILPWYRLVFHTRYTHNKLVMARVAQSLIVKTNQPHEIANTPLPEENLISIPNEALAPDDSPAVVGRDEILLKNNEFPSDLPPAKMTFIEGQEEGVQFSNVQPGGVFDRIGIKNGDIVQGCALENVNSPFEILAHLEKSNDPVTLNLCIHRDGVEINKQVIVQ